MTHFTSKNIILSLIHQFNVTAGYDGDYFVAPWQLNGYCTIPGLSLTGGLETGAPLLYHVSCQPPLTLSKGKISVYVLNAIIIILNYTYLPLKLSEAEGLYAAAENRNT